MGQSGTGPNGTRNLGPRCIALVGPFQSGKTTLLEAILARTGAIQRQGTVDAGTTVGDASKEARHHKMSVEATFATTNFMGDSYTFVDCPGSIEFIQDMRSARIRRRCSSPGGPWSVGRGASGLRTAEEPSRGAGEHRTIPVNGGASAAVRAMLARCRSSPPPRSTACCSSLRR